MRTPGAAAELLRLFRYMQDLHCEKSSWRIWGSIGHEQMATSAYTPRGNSEGRRSEDFRQAARHYLAEADTPEARDALLGWYAVESDEEIKLTVIAMLGTMYGDHAEVRTKLQEIADGPNLQLAKQVRGVLSGAGSRDDIPFSRAT